MANQLDLTAFADFIDYDEDGSEIFDVRSAGDNLAGTLCAIFRAEEDDFAVALLANSVHRLEHWTRDGAFSCFKWRITVPPVLFAEYKKQERDHGQWVEHNFDPVRQGDFLDRARFFAANLYDDIKETIVEPMREKDPNWRMGAQAYLIGEGINNQGNVYKTNRPRIIHDELRFRTMEEQYLYDALLNRHIPMMPLPVVLRGDGQKRPNGTTCRMEPDFCLLYKGRLVVLELDGGSHQETPADAETRLQFLRDNGAIVRRIHASKCDDSEKARVALSDVLKSIDREISARP
jgi:hypothetical protein